MAELIKLEVQELPEICVVGREIRPQHKDLMEGRNPIPAFWGECFGSDTFARLEAQGEHIYSPDYVGFMYDWGDMNSDFGYIVGMLMKPGASVPDGYVCAKVAACRAAVGFVRGESEADACAHAHSLTEQALKERGLAFKNMSWCMEVYNCPRWTTPDAQGRVTLDYYIPLD